MVLVSTIPPTARRRGSYREPARSLRRQALVAILLTAVAACVILPAALFLSLNGKLLREDETSPFWEQLRGQEEYQCLGWHTTTTTGRLAFVRSLYHKLFRKLGLDCDILIQPDERGYCELQDVTNGGKVLQYLNRTVESTAGRPRKRPSSAVTCSMANPDHIRLLQLQFSNPPTPDPPLPFGDTERGIVTLMESSEDLVNMYTIIKLLRGNYGCTLPIELWTTFDDDKEDGASIIIDNPLFQEILKGDDTINFRMIRDSRYLGGPFATIPYILSYTSFQEVLFLNSHSFPLRDPTFLFGTSAYQSKGAIFWKDLWSPQDANSTIGKDSMLWDVLGIPGSSPLRTEMEMDAGQMVIHRGKSQKALALLLLLARSFTQWLDPLQVMQEDGKDLYRFAWHLSNSHFHYVATPPGLARTIDTGGFFERTCSQTLVQQDPASEQPLFLHHQGPFSDFGSTQATTKVLWQQGDFFVGPSYQVGSYKNVGEDEDDGYPCFHPTSKAVFEVRTFHEGSDVAKLEQAIRKYTRKALALQQSTKSQLAESR